MPPTEIPKFRTQQQKQKNTASEPIAVVVNKPEIQQPGNSVNVSDRGSSVGTNDEEEQDTTSHSSLTSRGLNNSQGSNDPIVPVSRCLQKYLFLLQ